MRVPLQGVLLCASLLAGVALFEVGVRAAGVDYNLSPNWKYHPVLGWSQVPNGTYDVTVNGRPVHVSFNSLGFRDEEHQKEKPAGVKRVVVIGDSFSEAVQVNLEETFHQVLEALLNQGGTDRWEVINLGVGDFGTAQEFIALTEYGWAFEPDVVIHQIFPLNDICNNSLALYRLCRSHNDRYRPYFVEANGELEQRYRQPVRTWLRRHAVSWNTLEYWMLRVGGVDPQSAEDPGRDRRLKRRGLKGQDPLLLTFARDEDQPEAVAAGWHVTEALITRMVRQARERNARYIGMVAPFEIVFTPTWDKFVTLMPDPPMDRTYPERRLAAHFERLGVPSVILLDEFQPYLDEVLPYIDGHFTAAGHRRAAEALYRTMTRSGVAAR